MEYKNCKNEIAENIKRIEDENERARWRWTEIDMEIG